MANKDHYDKSMTDVFDGRFIVACAFFITWAMIMWFLGSMAISMHSHIVVQQLHIRENSSNSSNPNIFIVMDLEFKYPSNTDNLSITLYCASCESFAAIGSCVAPGFNASPRLELREAAVVPRGPSWDDARWRLSQGLKVELRVEITTSYITSEKCRHCSRSFREREKCHGSGCREPTPVMVVSDFLLDGSVKVTRIS
ncbi:hypothetical protein AAHA92_03365 [Salvia divinorum]|uniref:Uncharacterized protein n=1 Tax=Salvia divinorum TaxID=28513 RepID=A0ABD1IHY4_SALDI